MFTGEQNKIQAMHSYLNRGRSWGTALKCSHLLLVSVDVSDRSLPQFGDNNPRNSRTSQPNMLAQAFALLTYSRGSIPILP
jgi:hypothetical protein